MALLTVLADDLTGAADTAALISEAGANTMVISDCLSGFGTHADYDVNALFINMHSRTLSGAEAKSLHQLISGQLRLSPDTLIVKKMDIGFRGNAGYEIEGMMETLPFDVCFVLDSIADLNTFTLYGNQYAQGALLSKSVYASEDPLKAPSESHIPTILSKQTNLPIASIDIDAVKGSALVEAVSEALSAGARCLVFDAVSNADQDKIVSLLAPVYPNALWAGSLGLMQAVSNYLYGGVKKAKNIRRAKERALGFTSSAYSVVKRQLQVAELLGLHVETLDMDRVIRGDSSAIQQAAENVLAAIKDRDVFLKPRLSKEYECPDASERILEGMVACADIICREAEFERLVFVGGETAAAIMKKLEIDEFIITKKTEVGIGTGYIYSGKYKGKSISMKGGSVGSIEAIVKMLGYEIKEQTRGE